MKERSNPTPPRGLGIENHQTLQTDNKKSNKPYKYQPQNTLDIQSYLLFVCFWGSSHTKPSGGDWMSIDPQAKKHL